MQSKATTVSEYLKELPADRRAAISEIRKVIRHNLPKGFQEGMQYGMIGYFVPHRLYPDGYHCDPKQPLPYACLASQKNYMSLYLFAAYSDNQQDHWFQNAWKAAGKKLNMGKSCVRFKKLDDVPLDVVGAAIRRVSVEEFVEIYESSIKPSAKKKNRVSKQKSSQKRSSTTKSGSTRSTQQSPTIKKKKATKKKHVPVKKSAKKKIPKAKRNSTSDGAKSAKSKKSAKSSRNSANATTKKKTSVRRKKSKRRAT
ncbi:MAG: DUF1801 domain-containing protein [Rubripirellula sp.]